MEMQRVLTREQQKAEDIYYAYEKARNLLQAEIKKVIRECEIYFSTIGASNRHFRRGVLKAQKKAIDSIKTVHKPHVIYLINNYVKNCTCF